MSINKVSSVAALLLVLVLPLVSHAQPSGSYVALQLNVFQLDIEDKGFFTGVTTDRDSQPAGLTLKLGGHVYDWLAIEGQYTYGVASDEIEETGVNLNLESMAALSAVVNYQVRGPLRVFGKVGVARAVFESRTSEVADSNGLLYGAGFSLDVSEKSRLLWEYSLLEEGKFERSGNRFDTNSIAFGIQFDL